MHFSNAAVAALQQANRDALPDLCTVEVATRTAQPGGGAVEQWLPVSDDMVELPCRVSVMGASAEAGPSATRKADYVVTFDAKSPARGIVSKHRLAIRSGPHAVGAYAMVLYVLAIDGPQSLDAFPKVFCTVTPQPGQ